MKAFMIACAVAALVASVVCHRKEHKETMNKYSLLCVHDSNVDEARVMKLRKDKDFSDKNRALQNFVFCMFVKCGLVTPEGVFRRDVGLRMAPGGEKTKEEAADEACSALKGSSPQESVYLMAECYHKLNPGEDMF